MTEQQIKAVDLLPCPFCGTPEPEYDNCDYGSGKWYSCKGCPATVRVPYGKDLEKVWNTRAAMQVREMTVDEASAIFVDGFSGLLARWDTKTQKAYGDGLALALAKLGAIRIVEE